MSDYHFMEGERDSFKVVFHLPVPNELNITGGKNIRAAIAEDRSIDRTSRLPWIDVAEQAKLTNGSLFEHVETYSTHPGHTLIHDRTQLDTRFDQLSAIVANRLRRRYAFWRFERNIP